MQIEGDDVPRHFVQSLARGLAVIRAFDADHEEIALPELAERAGVSRAAARRFALTLVDLGYMDTADGRRFRLTPAVLQLGYAKLAQHSVGRICSDELERLAADTGEHTAAAAIDGGDVVYIASIHSQRLMSLDLDIGSRLPVSVTSLGRMLLAGMDDDQLDTWLATTELARLTEVSITDPAELRRLVLQARHDGYAAVVQELDAGLKSIAVAVRGGDGRVVASINVSMRVGIDRDRETERAELLTHLPGLKASAKAIEARLAAVGR